MSDEARRWSAPKAMWPRHNGSAAAPLAAGSAVSGDSEPDAHHALLQQAGVAGLTADTPWSQIEASLRRLRRLLDDDKTDALHRTALRAAAVTTLVQGGIRTAARLIDSALAADGPSERGAASRAQGTVITFDDPAPWPHAVDGAALLKDLAAILNRYLALPEGGADAMALWVAHTYALDAFDHTGYLAVVSPEKRCGKTTALQVIEALAYRALSADSVSPAVVFRVIEEYGPTLIIDELDRVPRDSELWQVLNSGYKRGRGVLRAVGDDHQVRRFSTFGPKVLGYIRDTRCQVPGTVEDRSIRVMMTRRARDEAREKVRSRELAREAAPLRSRLVRWAQDNLEALTGVGAAVPEELDDRAADTWEPLLAVAAVAGGRWPEAAARLALAMSEERHEDEIASASPGVQLLADLRDLLASDQLDVTAGLSGEEACRALREMAGRPWAEWGRNGKGLTPTTLARLLRPFGVKSERESRASRRYPTAALQEVLGRYLPSSP